MKSITYIQGDSTQPIGEDRKILIHCCNDIGKMGAGVAAAIARKWPSVRSDYLKWYRGGKGFKLGAVQFIKVEDDIVVGNMIGQHGIRTQGKVPPIRYGAISKCLEKVGIAAIRNKASIHCPRFGSALAGGSWDKIEGLINIHLCSKDLSVTVYSL